MSHTPGPWSVFGERPTPRNCGIDADTVPFSIVVWGNAGDEDQGVQGRTRDEMLANARLIAAAPDMFEALKLAQKWLCNCVPVVDLGEPYPMQAIAAAIAKAESQ